MSRTRAVRSGAWAMVLQLVRLGIQGGVFLLFSRYLPLAELGAYSFAYSFVQLTQTFVRSGVMETVVASPRDGRAYIASAFAVSFCIGLIAAALLFLIGMGAFLFEPAVGVILCTLAIVPVVDSLGIVPEALLRRRLQFSAITFRTTIGLVLAAALCLLAGYHGWGVHALVLFNIVASVVATVIVLCIVWRELPLTGANLADMKLVATPSFHVSLSTFASGSIVPASQIALGLFAGPVAVGAYAIAQRIQSLINSIVVDPVRVAALPVLSRLESIKERRRALLEVFSMCATFLSPLYLGLAAISPVALPFLLGANGAEAYPIFWVLSFHYVALIISMIIGQMLLVSGKSKEVLRYSSVQSLAGVVAGAAAAPFGAVAVAIAYVLRAYLILPLVFRQARIHGGVEAGSFVRVLAAPVLSGLAMQAVIFAFSSALIGGGMSPLLTIIASVLVGALVYGVLLLLFGRQQLIASIKLIGALIKSKRAKGAGS